MTEPLSQQPLRLMRKAKELPHPPHRVTLSSGEKSESQRRVLLCAPAPASHPVAFKPNPNQPVPRSLPGEAGYVLLSGGREGTASFLKLSFLLLSGPLLNSGGGGCNSHSLAFRGWPFAFASLTSRARGVPYCPICGPHSAKVGPGLIFLSSLTWTRNQS